MENPFNFVHSNPAVCGITLLDYDHVNELGDTLGKIMWHKAGICKPGHPVFSVPQEREPLEVLATRAKELQVQGCSYRVKTKQGRSQILTTSGVTITG